MATLFEVVEQMKVVFGNAGYTIFDINEFDQRKVTQADPSKFPIIFIGRKDEVINSNSTIDFLNNTAEVDINIVLNVDKENLFPASSTELRIIKDIIYTNRKQLPFWIDWTVTGNYPAQLANTEYHSQIFGGLNINTLVQYREQQIEGVI